MCFMQEKGFEVLTISSGGNEVAEVCKSENVRHIAFPLTRKITPLTDLYCLIKMVFFFLEYQPTIVHTHTKSWFDRNDSCKNC